MGAAPSLCLCLLSVFVFVLLFLASVLFMDYFMLAFFFGIWCLMFFESFVVSRVSVRLCLCLSSVMFCLCLSRTKSFLVKQQNGEGTKPEILLFFFGPVRNNCWLFLWNWQGEKLN